MNNFRRKESKGKLLDLVNKGSLKMKNFYDNEQGSQMPSD
jgi:hypothetical protein